MCCVGVYIMQAWLSVMLIRLDMIIEGDNEELYQLITMDKPARYIILSSA